MVCAFYSVCNDIGQFSLIRAEDWLPRTETLRLNRGPEWPESSTHTSVTPAPVITDRGCCETNPVTLLRERLWRPERPPLNEPYGTL